MRRTTRSAELHGDPTGIAAAAIRPNSQTAKGCAIKILGAL